LRVRWSGAPRSPRDHNETEDVMRLPTHDIVVTDFDRRRLMGLLQLLRHRPGSVGEHLDALEHQLARARVVAPERVPSNVVTMNSRVCLRDLESGERSVVALVFPDGRATGASSTPVVSALGLSLLGCREGDSLDWRAAEGWRRLRVECVLYQPEASGNYAC
jgi:regulator of nucleoside diphosphate kinase